ncbi:MAG: hypothetical protein MJ113_04940 [Lachnospiraceae bacterium]|nr:hypothetical protein [Lachnospiraceae bacterium]
MRFKFYSRITAVLLLVFSLFLTSVKISAAQLSFWDMFEKGNYYYANYLSLLQTNPSENMNGNYQSFLDYSALVYDSIDKCFCLPNNNYKSRDNIGSNNYVLQGITKFEFNNVPYTLISAYYKGTANKNSTILIKPDDSIFYVSISFEGIDCHFGGLCATDNYLFVTGEPNAIYRISIDDLMQYYIKAVPVGNYGNIVKEVVVPKDVLMRIQLQADVLTSFVYYDQSTKLMWIGNWTDRKSTSVAFAYSEEQINSNVNYWPYSNKVYIPLFTQSMATRKINGVNYILFSRSRSTSPYNANFVSELLIYKDFGYYLDENGDITEVVLASGIDNPYLAYILPPMSEGVYIDEDYTYIVYESNAALYAESALITNYCLATDTNKLLKIDNEISTAAQELLLESVIKESLVTDKINEEQKDDTVIQEEIEYNQIEKDTSNPLNNEISKDNDTAKDDVDFDNSNKEDDETDKTINEELSEGKEKSEAEANADKSIDEKLDDLLNGEYVSGFGTIDTSIYKKALYDELRTYILVQRMLKKVVEVINEK